MGGQNPQECSWNSEELLDKGWHGQALPGARSPGESEVVCLGPGTRGTALSGVTTELRDWRVQGTTEGDILADHRPAEQLWMNRDLGIWRGKGGRQPPVKGPLRGQVRIRHWLKTHGISSAFWVCDCFGF